MSTQKLTVFSTYVTRENLASYRVGTPDPSLNCPSVGQKLIITWRLCPEDLTQEPLLMRLNLRFHNRTYHSQDIPITTLSGTYVYSLLNKEFFESEGLMAYKVELIGNNNLISEWRHKIWVDPILFNNSENEFIDNTEDEAND
ncbi:MAG: hypothetical protein H0U49_00360 [Parachlamydiaceae bacterium]|nr:hypothetical protein [Parachlamydiaceae bacterium]